MSIHDELQRIADRAPVVEVAEDTWARARRARTRDRALLLAGAAAVVLLAAVLVWVPTPSDPPVADTDSTGVPDRLWAPEDRLDATSDLDVGVAAVAWPEGRRVMVVGADGDYHLLEPPGYDDLLMTGHAVALSPDGTQLAYAWAEPGRATGVHVADLVDGDVRSVSFPGDDVAVERLVWSPDSQSLAWQGSTITWQDSGFTGSGQVAGRIAPGAEVAEEVGPAPGDSNLALAVGDGGLVHLVSTNGLVQALPDWRERVRHAFGRLSPTAVVDPATGVLGVGVGGNGPTDRPAPGTVGLLVSPASGDTRPLRSPTGGEVLSTPLGFVGGDLLVAVTSLDGGEHTDRRIELLGTGHEPRRVVAMDDLVPDELTLATDLMTPDRLTVHHPEPDWPTPWWDVPRLLLFALGAFALAGLLRTVVLHLRRR